MLRQSIGSVYALRAVVRGSSLVWNIIFLLLIMIFSPIIVKYKNKIPNEVEVLNKTAFIYFFILKLFKISLNNILNIY